MDLSKNFHKKVLKNGMTVIFEKRNVPVVSVAFAVRAGGINEEISEKGISHFIEHMMYKGTKTRTSKQIAEEIEKNGGELNGFTSEEITAYYCKMPSKHLDIALDVLADIIKNSVFDEKELEKERKVIFEEIKMRRDTPKIYVFDEIQSLLYGKPLGLNLIGTRETMNPIDRKKIMEKFKQIYEPNNFILCIVGDADFEQIIKFAEKNFGSGKSQIPKQKFELKNETKIEEREGVDQANLVFAYHVPVSNDDKCHSAKVLSSLMIGGMSSRLFEEIREKRNLAYAIHGDSNINRDFAYNLIYAGTMKENVDKVKELITKEFEKVSAQLNEEELNQTKEQLIGNYQISMEDSQTQMVNLLVSEIQRDAKDFYEYEKNISKVKLKDVKDLAKKAITEYSFFALVPKDKK
ncbi:MAG: pitrilysin family protein [Nanoarchaeota archaeon]|nr:pitrilysin family protein [Nanoarchaeota archaeon]